MPFLQVGIHCHCLEFLHCLDLTLDLVSSNNAVGEHLGLVKDSSLLSGVVCGLCGRISEVSV